MKTELITKLLDKHNKCLTFHVSHEAFIDNARRYIKAIKENRMMCCIESVSNSGMSRNIKFFEMSKAQKVKPTRYNILNFYQFFECMGYKSSKNSDSFKIHGCGMDMVFYTNYSIIHELYNLGFLTKKECDYLAQKTPQVV